MSESETSVTATPSCSPGSTQPAGSTPSPSSRFCRKANFKLSSIQKESHRAVIYGCQFHPELEPPTFATVAGNEINIYECVQEKKKFELVATFHDNVKESFYCCAWTTGASGNPIIAAAGERRIVKIVEIPENELPIEKVSLVGHGGAINHLLFHPKHPHLLLSSSQDRTLRLTNINTNCLVATFGGCEGHVDQILSADIHLNGSRLVSGGMDGVKTWSLKTPEIKMAIEQSSAVPKRAYRTARARDEDETPETVRCSFPDFSDRRNIHTNYVDCVKWFGLHIVSKDASGNIFIWRPISSPTPLWKNDFEILREFKNPVNSLWFVRFTICKELLAIGNQAGVIYVYNLAVADKKGANQRPLKLVHKDSKSQIRQADFSVDVDGIMTLICAGDDGSVMRWDLMPRITRA